MEESVHIISFERKKNGIKVHILTLHDLHSMMYYWVRIHVGDERSTCVESVYSD